jgi:hypothetical protein
MTSSYTGTPSDWETPKNLDPYDLLFDEDKARKAASAVKIFQDVSVGSTKEKMKEEGEQQRATIGTSGKEQRETAAQAQRFSQEDEARDYEQSQRAYRY